MDGQQGVGRFDLDDETVVDKLKFDGVLADLPATVGRTSLDRHLNVDTKFP
jgi:hypothetical protein